jgi:hypothetical protein
MLRIIALTASVVCYGFLRLYMTDYVFKITGDIKYLLEIDCYILSKKDNKAKALLVGYCISIAFILFSMYRIIWSF